MTYDFLDGILGTSPDTPLRGFSYGGGKQSNTVLALQAMGKLKTPYDFFVFANVGNDSENPETITYIEEHAKPFAQKHGIPFIEVQKTYFGEPDTVRQSIMRENTTSIIIPAYYISENTGFSMPAKRACTDDYKIRQVDKLIKKMKAQYAVIGIGISTDEFRRVRTDFLQYRNRVNPRNEKSTKLGFWKKVEYPLIDLKISRSQCTQILFDAGLPDAPKSSCFFARFTRNRYGKPYTIIIPICFKMQS